MNGDTRQHPGRSAEFLSRLHDGELDAAERAHFEAHRAHCAECRRAALEFEDALAMFRSARSKPAQPDLAARILRKIQTTSRPRAPFGRRFRMDLGWAALVLTGIFALLLTTPIAIRREEPPIVVSLPTPEPAAPSVSERDAAAEPESVPETDRLLRDDRSRRDRPVPAAPPPPASNKSRPAEAPAPAPAIAVEEREYDSQADSASSERRPALGAEVGRASGGEARTSAAAAAPAAPLKLRIEAIDGYGAAPPLLSAERIALPSGYRGHEFILNVDSQGKVSEIRPGPSRDRKEETTALAVPATAPSALSELRFEPGNRPRRLLVRFE